MTAEPVAHRRRDRRVGGGIPQLPFRRLTNPFQPLEVLTADHVEEIHRTSLRILAEVGVEVLGDRAIELLAADGATVDRANRRVRLDPALVEARIATAPAEFTLHARNPERNVILGGRSLVFSSVGGPAFVSDLDRGRRAGNWADFQAYVRLIGALNVIHQEAGGPLEPTDLPVETRHLDMYGFLATTLDKTWHCLGFGATVVEDALEVVAIARGVDRETLEREPSLITIINTNSPLRLDGPMSEGLIAMAAAGQAVVATPFTLAGAMSPVSLAGAIAQQNAEALFCVVLTQLVRPGAPVVYGAFTSNVDMRTGSPAFGTPEYVKGAIASGQMARRYRLPWRSSNATASVVVDAQAAYESEMAVWGAVMGGVNLLYQGAGWLEGGLTASYEKLIVDAEILQMISEVLQPIAVDEASLGLDAIAEVGPGGHFFGSAHTLERFETAFYQPILSDWRNFETWADDGAHTATERANRIWKQLLAESEPPPLDPAAADGIAAFVARRKREITSGSG
ncbi:MAG TPA: trimethylamine methyltransferase family protein [Candidatus Limnocylindrales bacterium]|nr:trimethylamine methyltransferase family protein [Candidatus Limnocylindrales bacterium]